MATTSPLGLRYPALTGVTPNVPRDLQALAEDVQQAVGSVSAGLQEGVLDAGSFEVTQASGGASMTLDIASNTGSGAFVDDDGLSPARVGRYYVPPTAAKSTVTVGAAHATLPRVDRIVVSTAGVVSLVAGTATSGATLDNLTGAAAVPADSLLLADAHVPATDTTISNSQIRDRRKWARGANASVATTLGIITSSTATESTATRLRIECSGQPVVITIDGGLTAGTANKIATMYAWMDGVAQGTNRPIYCHGTPNSDVFHQTWVVTPAAGSHVFSVARSSNDNTTTMVGEIFDFRVTEQLGQTSGNNTTTSG